MGTLLLFLAALAAVFWVFARLIRSRVAKSLQDREMPPELTAALQARAAAASPAGRPAVRAAGVIDKNLVSPALAHGASAGVIDKALRPPALAHGASPALHFLLIYDVGPDYLARRAQFRDEHLALAWKAANAGELVLGGALEEPVEQAFLLFRGSREAALRFAAADPYVKNGLVKSFKVKQWHTVAGATAANPLRPKS